MGPAERGGVGVGRGANIQKMLKNDIRDRAILKHGL